MVMKPKIIPRWSIQKDWQQVEKDFLDGKISQQEAQFWVSRYSMNDLSIHGKIQLEKYAETLDMVGIDGIYARKQHNVHIPHWNSRKIQVSMVPDFEKFSTIVPVLQQHKTAKSIESLDISFSGELAIASQGSAVEIFELDPIPTSRRVLSGHLGDVLAVKFFPSGKVALSAGSDMQVKIWDCVDGTCPVTLVGHKASVCSVDIVSRGRNIISGSKDSTIKLWECASASTIHSYSVDSAVTCIALCTRPSDIAIPPKLDEREVETSGKLCLYVSETGEFGAVDIAGKEKAFNIGLASSLSVLSCMGESHAATGCNDGKVLFWDLRNLESPLYSIQRNEGPITSICGVDERKILIGSGDGSMFEYNLITSETKEFTTDDSPVFSIAVTDGYAYAAGRSGSIQKFSL